MTGYAGLDDFQPAVLALIAFIENEVKTAFLLARDALQDPMISSLSLAGTQTRYAAEMAQITLPSHVAHITGAGIAAALAEVGQKLDEQGAALSLMAEQIDDQLGAIEHVLTLLRSFITRAV